MSIKTTLPKKISLVIALLLGLALTAKSFAQQPVRLDVPLSGDSMQPILNSIVQATSQRAKIEQLSDGRFKLTTADETVVLEFSIKEMSLSLMGTPKLANSLARLATALVQQRTQSDIRVVPISQTGCTALSNEAVFGQNQEGNSSGNTANQQSAFTLPTFRGFKNVHLASAQQESVPEPSAPPDAAAADDQTEDQQLRGLPLQQFDGVQVEMLPEIDAIILRGRDKQLEDLAQIIKQLDEASRIAQPEIEVLLLQHVNAQSLSALILQTQQSVLALRQGRVVALPLSNPNAVLLIGWGDALQLAKQLIAKLDVATPSSSSFDVIQLKHASAVQVQTQLQSFYQARGNLAPIIQSAADARTNAIIIHAAPRDLEEIRSLIARLDVARGEAVLQSKVFEIRNGLAVDVAASLRQALAGTPSDANMPIEVLDQDGKPIASSNSLAHTRIAVNDRNNTLIITSAAENLAMIEQLIEQLDTPGQIAKIKIFPIINADAAALVETLRSLIPSSGPGTTAAAAGPQLSSSPDESSLIPLRFTVDGRGNNIIAVGSEGDLKIVEALIVRLDESDTLQRKNTVYQLKNSPAVDIALAVNEFLRNKRQVENNSPGSVNPFEQLEREVVVVPEPVQNKLIVSATPRYYEEIRTLIEQLDQQPPQVMIQVLIAEVTLGATHEFGMEMGLQSSVLFDRSLLGDLLTRTTTTTTSTPAGVVTQTTQDIIAASNSPGFDFNNNPLGNSGSQQALARSGVVGGQGLSNFSVGRTNEDLGFGGLVLSASSENVSFLLRALEDSQHLEILSRPQVLTLDNQAALIQIGQRIPRVTTANVSQFGFQTGVELMDIGLIIGVTPRISPEGNVVMEIDAEKSKIRPDTDGIPIAVAQNGSVIRSPIFDSIAAQATVSAADGETIILGGLISKESRSIQRKVPWLGDLPVLKYLFSYEYDQLNRSELLIILTPHVVRSQADMQRVKQAEFARMSWCEADVVDLHGDINICVGPQPGSLDSNDWQVVYPDVEPRGRPLDVMDNYSSPSDSSMIPVEPMSQPSRHESSELSPRTAQNPVNSNSVGNAQSGLTVPALYQRPVANELSGLGLPTVSGGQ